MDNVSKFIDVKRSYLHHTSEEHFSVGWHLNLEKRHHHDELLRVDHCPEVLQRARNEEVDDKVGGDNCCGSVRSNAKCLLDYFFSATDLDLSRKFVLEDYYVFFRQSNLMLDVIGRQGLTLKLPSSSPAFLVP